LGPPRLELNKEIGREESLPRSHRRPEQRGGHCEQGTDDKRSSDCSRS
jgi:hypothetical protein